MQLEGRKCQGIAAGANVAAKRAPVAGSDATGWTVRRSGSRGAMGARACVYDGGLGVNKAVQGAEAAEDARVSKEWEALWSKAIESAR